LALRRPHPLQALPELLEARALPVVRQALEAVDGEVAPAVADAVVLRRHRIQLQLCVALTVNRI
jgi:hypothetical protein